MELNKEMTSEEAIEWLAAIERDYIHGGDEWFDEQRRKAVALGKNALSLIKELTEENKQFRYERKKLIEERDTFKEYAYNMQKYVENIRHKEEEGYEPSAARAAAEMEMWQVVALEKKKLTEENEAWQKRLITEEEKASKAYYELACEVENLRAENERLRAERDVLDTTVKDLRGRNKGLQRANESLAKDIAELETELGECVQIKADTVRKMQERLKDALNDMARYDFHGNNNEYFIIGKSFIDQIAKDILKESEENGNQTNR